MCTNLFDEITYKPVDVCNLCLNYRRHFLSVILTKLVDTTKNLRMKWLVQYIDLNVLIFFLRKTYPGNIFLINILWLNYQPSEKDLGKRLPIHVKRYLFNLLVNIIASFFHFLCFLCLFCLFLVLFRWFILMMMPVDQTFCQKLLNYRTEKKKRKTFDNNLY